MSKARSASRVVAYLPSLKTILLRLRATSATPSSLSSTLLTTATPTNSTGDHFHQQALTPFTGALCSPIPAHLPLHPSLPLPGAVGIGLHETTPTNSHLTTTSTLTGKHKTTESSQSSKNEMLECVVQKIPGFLVADLMLLFPGVSVPEERLNVITLSQQTVNNMTSWSPDVEQEREQLLEHFVDSAKEICSRLTGAGYWADFVDPSSGRAYYSAYSSATLFETDDRLRYFGFDIVDLGCCKCIHHPVWGAFTFVGLIFTSAPTDSGVIQTIMEL